MEKNVSIVPVLFMKSLFSRYLLFSIRGGGGRLYGIRDVDIIFH